MKKGKMKEIFQKVADTESGQYLVEERSHVGQGMSIAPVTIHQLTFNYKNCKLIIINEFGNSNVGTIRCYFASGLRLPDFQVKTKSQFWKIFNSRSPIVKVTCAQAAFKTRLERKITDHGLEEIACEHLFQPEINGQYQDKCYTIQSRYHLQFSNKLKVLIPFIRVHKQLIDEAVSKINS